MLDPAGGADPVADRLRDRRRVGDVVSTAPPPLAADLNDGLRRLKLAAMRRLAPELLRHRRRPSGGHPRSSCAPWSRPRSPPGTPPTPAPGCEPPRSRWSRPSTSSTSPRPRSRRPPSTTSPPWSGSGAAENLCLIGPAGTGKSHLLVALGVAAVEAGHRVRYFTAADLVETLYRGLADNSVGRVIDTLLRNDLIICRRGRLRPAGRHRRPTAVPVRRRRLRTPRPGHRLPLALRVLGPVPARTHHRRQPARPAPAPRQRRGHRRRLLPHEPSPSPRRCTPARPADQPEGWGLLVGHQRGPQLGR